MSIVTNKYTPGEMSEQELLATFAAREHTVDYLLKSLRDQIHHRTLSSFVITGPRGAGKSTIIRIVALRIRQDPQLNAAWIPLVFPEEQFNMISLRDTLAAILQVLGGLQIPSAQDWLEKVEAESNDEQSQQLAMTGLKEITRQTGKRLILFIENLDQLLGRNLDDQMKGTLRRLLMSEPFMMIIGSTVHIFDSLKDYDEAFFNYFGQVSLGRLEAEQVSEILRKRAQFDNNERFLRELPQQQAKVKTLVHLTGGNPRFVLMLYELLTSQSVTSIVQYLHRLVDELTPLLKHEMENLPPQQQKIIDALMRKGGTAQPSDLVGLARLPLNAVTTQLKRLKDAQIVEVLGGGKGRAAHYTVPDQLFSIWYQMRYLNQNRRRIELFVEVLRVWFEEEERIQTLQSLVEKVKHGASNVLRECATTGEYFAASLKGTKHELLARDLCIRSWLMADIKEAAFVYADASGAVADYTAFLKIKAGDRDTSQFATALMFRGSNKEKLGETEAAMRDYDAAIALDNLPKDIALDALLRRGCLKKKQGRDNEAILDFTKISDAKNVPPELLANALNERAKLKAHSGDSIGAVADFNKVIELKPNLEGVSAEALFGRGILRFELDDIPGAIDDYCGAIKSEKLPAHLKQQVIFIRGLSYACLGKLNEAAVDLTGLIDQSLGVDEFISGVIEQLFVIAWDLNRARASQVLEKLLVLLGNSTKNVGQETLLRLLHYWASSEYKEAWLFALHYLSAKLDPKVAESLKFFKPVASVLESKDRSLLDALPPEQREFALSVLAKFAADGEQQTPGKKKQDG